MSERELAEGWVRTWLDTEANWPVLRNKANPDEWYPELLAPQRCWKGEEPSPPAPALKVGDWVQVVGVPLDKPGHSDCSLDSCLACRVGRITHIPERVPWVMMSVSDASEWVLVWKHNLIPLTEKQVLALANKGAKATT